MALAQTSDSQRQQALEAMAGALEEDAEAIVAANRADLEAAEHDQLAAALLGRL